MTIPVGLVRLPALSMPYEFRGSAPGMDAIVKDLWTWLDRFGLPATQAMREQLRRTRPELTTALYYPHADTDSLRLPARCMALGFIIDDLFDDAISAHDVGAATAFADELADLARGSGRPISSAGHAFVDVITDLCCGRSEAWRAAVAEANSSWLATYRVEAEHPRCRMSFSDYLPHRRASVGEFVFFHLYEYVAGIELPAEIRDLPAMTQARERGSEWIALYNDLYSAGKEAAVDYPFNAVHLLQRLHGCSVQAGADRTAAVLDGLIGQFEAACLSATAQIRAISDEPSILDDAETVLDGYRCLLRGNFDYHPRTDRYRDVAAYTAVGPHTIGAAWSGNALSSERRT